MSRFVTGTIAALAGKLTLNGVVLGQPELSVMTRIFAGKAFRQVGIVKREGERGRPAIIWSVDTEVAAFFEVNATADQTGLTVSDDEPVDYVKAAAPAEADATPEAVAAC